MYNIITLIKSLLVTIYSVICNPFFHSQKNGSELLKFYEFICENNPLLLDYADILDFSKETEEEQEEIKKVLKFEDKYLEKFNNFSNEYYFTELELDDEKKEYERIKMDYENKKYEIIYKIQEKLSKIDKIQEKGNISTEKNENGVFTENINQYGIDKLIKYFDLEDELPDDLNFEDLYLNLLNDKMDLLKKMKEAEKIIMTNDEMRLKSRENIINKKLDKCMNLYVVECTPLGNVCMRYNNDKKSFEYFSNNSIPYRYLESVGRKYVTTYWCKPIFVNIEEEIKKAEEKNKEEKEKEKEDKNKKNNPRKMFAQLKSYKETPKNNKTHEQRKNTKEQQLVKENANRYTWEGRLTNFCPLKKIDKKLLDKKLAMTYADFKKIQQCQ
jgi:hypothetical protein